MQQVNQVGDGYDPLRTGSAIQGQAVGAGTAIWRGAQAVNGRASDVDVWIAKFNCPLSDHVTELPYLIGLIPAQSSFQRS